MRIDEKGIRSILILCLLIGSVNNLWAQPEVSFDRTIHNLGSILWNIPVSTEFSVTNTGNSPLLISNVTVSCACAVSDWTKNTIEPGKSGKIKVTFDAKALGRFEKSVAIYSNATPQPAYLTLKGRVLTEVLANENDFPFRVGDIGLDKNNIEFSDAYWGQIMETELTLMNLSDAPYEPQLMHLPAYLTAEYYPAVIPKEGVGKVKLKLDTRFLRNLGLNQTTIYLARFPGDRVREESEIVVSAILLPEPTDRSVVMNGVPKIELSETTIDLGSFGKKDKLTHTVTIINRGTAPLEISKLQVFTSATGASLKKAHIPVGGSTKMKITLFKKDMAKLKSSPRILMITNDPDQPKIVIKVKATID